MSLEEIILRHAEGPGRCECEHARHGRGCPAAAAQTVRTTYGPFRVCPACVACMADPLKAGGPADRKGPA